MSKRRRLACFISGGALAALLLLPGATNAAAAGSTTCTGGPVAGGTYSSLTISGFCAIAAGNVIVTGNLTIVGGGVLGAAFAGSDLHVGGNLLVESGGIAVLGCEPFAFACFNDPNQPGGTPGFETNHTIGRNLVGDGALMVLAHASTIGGNVVQSGGPGVTCGIFPLGPDGPPAYSTYEDNVIGGNAAITGLRTCWAGFFRNKVGGNTIWSDNLTADEDGNEIADNSIHGNLNCFANDPAVQFGDSGGSPSTVGGKVNGQCTAVA